MKRLALVAAVLVIAACTAREERASDTSAPAMTPPPVDSLKDSLAKDSVAKP